MADPFDATDAAGGSAGASGGSVQVIGRPRRSGRTSCTSTSTTRRAGSPSRDIRVRLAEEQQEIGPLDVDIAAAGPGRYAAEDMTVPTRRHLALTVTVRLDEFTATTAPATFPVR